MPPAHVFAVHITTLLEPFGDELGAELAAQSEAIQLQDALQIELDPFGLGTNIRQAGWLLRRRVHGQRRV
jgi:hypothetical protein